MLCIGVKMDSAYLKGKMQFGFGETTTDNTSNENLKDFRDSLILKNMEVVYGVIPANAIIKYVSLNVGKSRLDLILKLSQELLSKFMVKLKEKNSFPNYLQFILFDTNCQPIMQTVYE